MQRRIVETELLCHVIEPGTPDDVMYNIFKRINTEGKPLAGQEIRHALNPGPVGGLLKDLAASDEFLTATDRSINPMRMADRECVLRFLAFRSIGVEKYGGKLDGFLMSAMKLLNEGAENHGALRNEFRRAMRLAANIFGREAFRKPSQPERARWPVNKALFESLSVALAELPEEREAELEARKTEIVDHLAQLMQDPELLDSISVGTHTTKKVIFRFERMRKMLQEVLP